MYGAVWTVRGVIDPVRRRRCPLIVGPCFRAYASHRRTDADVECDKRDGRPVTFQSLQIPFVSGSDCAAVTVIKQAAELYIVKSHTHANTPCAGIDYAVGGRYVCDESRKTGIRTRVPGAARARRRASPS
ncbi:hypothetical protein EVAR_54735_1 [Eumeta japonica]|uniref:Uncharacterized protein n=1 Tax=Eumeta variegata TaxID=151549 RepID=A0A4C1Z160_EUMVA|nr:hypothetical protein EVAR_54735_1 [Eumeta japonica]